MSDQHVAKNKLKGLTISCLSTSAWSGLWTRKQWIMQKLSADNRILYVDPQESLTYRLRCWWRRRAFPGETRIPPGLELITPWSALPLGRHWRAAHSVNIKLLERQMVAAEGFLNPDIWWLYDPVVVPIVERRSNRLLVYDCVDRHSAYGGYRGLLDSLERRLLSQADLVFVTARGLYDHCAQWAKETHFLPNGFDEDLFNQSMETPAQLESVSGPILGFVGGVAHWLDYKLIAAAAKAKPDWSFVFVGPIGDLGSPVPRAPNIHWLGRCRREEVPAFISGFDVGLIPFKESFLTKTVNPLKAYEYLAAGIPVLSTRLPELDHMDLIPQAEGLDDFIAHIENALSDGKGDEMSSKRREAVADYSLQRTMAKMSDIIAEKL